MIHSTQRACSRAEPVRDMLFEEASLHILSSAFLLLATLISVRAQASDCAQSIATADLRLESANRCHAVFRCVQDAMDILIRLREGACSEAEAEMARALLAEADEILERTTHRRALFAESGRRALDVILKGLHDRQNCASALNGIGEAVAFNPLDDAARRDLHLAEMLCVRGVALEYALNGVPRDDDYWAAIRGHGAAQRDVVMSVRGWRQLVLRRFREHESQLSSLYISTDDAFQQRRNSRHQYRLGD